MFRFYRLPTHMVDITDTYYPPTRSKKKRNKAPYNFDKVHNKMLDVRRKIFEQTQIDAKSGQIKSRSKHNDLYAYTDIESLPEGVYAQMQTEFRQRVQKLMNASEDFWIMYKATGPTKTKTPLPNCKAAFEGIGPTKYEQVIQKYLEAARAQVKAARQRNRKNKEKGFETNFAIALSQGNLPQGVDDQQKYILYHRHQLYDKTTKKQIRDDPSKLVEKIQDEQGKQSEYNVFGASSHEFYNSKTTESARHVGADFCFYFDRKGVAQPVTQYKDFTQQKVVSLYQHLILIRKQGNIFTRPKWSNCEGNAHNFENCFVTNVAYLMRGIQEYGLQLPPSEKQNMTQNKYIALTKRKNVQWWLLAHAILVGRAFEHMSMYNAKGAEGLSIYGYIAPNSGGYNHAGAPLTSGPMGMEITKLFYAFRLGTGEERDKLQMKRLGTMKVEQNLIRQVTLDFRKYTAALAMGFKQLSSEMRLKRMDMSLLEEGVDQKQTQAIFEAYGGTNMQQNTGAGLWLGLKQKMLLDQYGSIWSPQKASLASRLAVLLAAACGSRRIELIRFSTYVSISDEIMQKYRALLRGGIFYDDNTSRVKVEKDVHPYIILQLNIAKEKGYGASDKGLISFQGDEGVEQGTELTKAVLKPLIGFVDAPRFVAMQKVLRQLIEASLIQQLIKSNPDQDLSLAQAQKIKKTHPNSRIYKKLKPMHNKNSAQLTFVQRYEDLQAAGHQEQAINQLGPVTLQGNVGLSSVPVLNNMKDLVKHLMHHCVVKGNTDFDEESKVNTDKFHFLRAVYAAMAHHQFAKGRNINQMVFIAQVLGHGSRQFFDMSTAKHYASVNVVDRGIQPGNWEKPKNFKEAMDFAYKHNQTAQKNELQFETASIKHLLQELQTLKADLHSYRTRVSGHVSNVRIVRGMDQRKLELLAWLMVNKDKNLSTDAKKVFTSKSGYQKPQNANWFRRTYVFRLSADYSKRAWNIYNDYNKKQGDLIHDTFAHNPTQNVWNNGIPDGKINKQLAWLNQRFLEEQPEPESPQSEPKTKRARFS